MPEVPESVRAAVRQHTDEILSLPNVIGVGVARRRVEGHTTDEYAIVAYVSRKLPPELLASHDRVPRELETEETSVRTDVVEINEPRFLEVDTRTYRPVRGGCQIASTGGVGTAGAVMYDRRDQQPVLLTNNHVLTREGEPTVLPPDTRVWQAAGGPQVGSSKRIVPMVPAPLGEWRYRHEATVDAGIVSVNSNVDVDFSVVDLGRHPYVVLPPHEGLEVAHRGFRTQYRTGTVEAVDLTIIIRAANRDLHRIGGSGCVFSIRAPELLITAMRGDSGSLVVDIDGAARGLVFAADLTQGGLTWACELGQVMSDLELDSPCTGGLSALIRRAVRRRLADLGGLREEPLSASGDALVRGFIDTTDRFRHRYLPVEPDGKVAGAIGSMLQRCSVDLAEALHQDEDLAGLFERAFGEWLLQPTVYDMLEYRLPETFPAAAIEAFQRFRQLRPDVEQLQWVESAFRQSAGLAMREVLTRQANPSASET